MAQELISLLSTLLLLSGVQSRLIDLSHDHGPDAIMSIQQPHYYWRQVFQGEFIPGMYSETGSYFTGEHGGTHMDVPAHFSRGGWRVQQVPLELTIADGVMIDCSYEASRNRSYLMPIQKILEWEATNGQIPDNAAVIFNFGWSQYFNNFAQYLGTPNNVASEMTFPSVSREVGDFLYDQRNIRIIGTDTPTPDPFGFSDMPIHQKYLPNTRLIVEHLKDTGSLPPRNFRFHAPPVKYVNATGAQVRAFAITYDTSRDHVVYDGAPSAETRNLVIVVSTFAWAVLGPFV
ncbi:unnamed protein product [Lymnaea stagnalis]|uniref:Kynurenine formamidase n=1 Tax=Lymnaea stagnalis TaxID=6523 RepID=A0AAV2HDF6_LYMST